MNYKILNSVSVMDMTEEQYNGNELYRHSDEIDNILHFGHGYEVGYLANTCYIVRFWDGRKNHDTIEVMTIYDATQALNIKEGVDVVEYESGNVGIVAYNGIHENGFEILSKAESTIKDYIDILWNEIERVTVEDTDGNELVEVCKEDIECGEIEDYENCIVVDFWTYDGNPNARHIVLTIEEERA